MKRPNSRQMRRLAAHVLGEASPRENSAALAECQASAALDHERESLAALDARLRQLAPGPEIDLLDDVRRAIEHGRSRSHRDSRSRRSPWVAALALVALSVIALPQTERWLYREKSVQDGQVLASKRSISAIRIYGVSGDSPPNPRQLHMRKDEGWLFSYRNRGRFAYRYLMIFAVDEKNDVFWFYPAYERTGTNPRSTSIQSGEREFMLPDVVRHDIQGAVRVVGLFSQKPVSVSEVEQWVHTSHGTLEPRIDYAMHLDVVPVQVGD